MMGPTNEQIAEKVATRVLQQNDGDRQAAIHHLDLAARKFFAIGPDISDIYRKARDILGKQVSP